MTEVTQSAVLTAPAAAVWSLLEDFGNLQRWWPDDGPLRIEHVELEGQGIGMIRHIKNHGVDQRVSERIDLLDPATRTLVLSIVGSRPMGLTAYVAEGHVVELDAQHCRIDYRGIFTCTPGAEEHVRRGLLKTWALMFKGLEATAKRAAGTS